MKVYLSDGQYNKLKSAFNKGEEVTLQINKSKTPNYEIHLDKTQINQLNKGKRITISKKHTNGGFLQFLLPLAFAAAKALGVGAATGVGAWGAKKLLDKATGKGLRHPFEKGGSLTKRKSLERGNNEIWYK